MRKKIITKIPFLLLLLVMGIQGVRKGIEMHEAWRIVVAIAAWTILLLFFILAWTTNIFNRKNNF